MSRRQGLVALITGFLAVVIAYLTLSPDAPGLDERSPDKLYHAIAFAALVFPSAFLRPRGLGWVIPAALVFGGAIELIQPWVGRSGEWGDFAADLVGVGLGVTAGLLLRRLRQG
ncbi:teicoplanin resistance protein VanZ [Salibaculum griseiflavum]|jgi:VanZ family protein|uniref:Teicoplanin resistance protein VanZ n=2 Tax=Salibaculum griseiflavum TaxID=1914409 RepID=A0A2V1P006_9RHOB|nr:teicoplanin resistance protein VanZ [Salibaculum griseiflavum]